MNAHSSISTTAPDRKRAGLRESIVLGNFPTRLRPLPSLAAKLGVDLWIKHEYEADGFGAGNKVRKLEFLIPEVVRGSYSGVVADGTTQSNSAMAIALYAPRYGLSVDLILYGSTTHGGNYVDILRSGARIELLPAWSPRDIALAQERIVKAAQGEGRQLYVVPTGATNETTAFAGIDLAEELARQEDSLGMSFEYVIFPTASGGTHAGLEIGRVRLGRPWKLIGVGVANNEAFLRGVVESIANSPQCRSLGDYDIGQVRPRVHMGALGQGYGVPLPGAYADIKELRTRFGLLLDSVYTHKAYVGLCQLIQRRKIRPGSSVVFIHTGGLNERFVDISDEPATTH